MANENAIEEKAYQKGAAPGRSYPMIRMINGKAHYDYGDGNFLPVGIDY